MPTVTVVATGVPLSPPAPSLKTTKYFVPEVYNEQIHSWHKRPFLMMTSSESSFLWNSQDGMMREGRRLLREENNQDVEGLVLSTIDGSRILLSAKSGNIREGQSVFLTGTFLCKVYRGRDRNYVQEFREWVEKKVGVNLNPEREILILKPEKPAEDHKEYVVYFARIRHYS